MKEVSVSHIDALLSPLIGLADDDEAVAKYRTINQNDASEVKAVIGATIRPYFDLYDTKSKGKAKDSLSYYLSLPGSDFERLYYSNLLPFDALDDPKNFFIWLWEELFQGYDYKMDKLAEFQVNDGAGI